MTSLFDYPPTTTISLGPFDLHAWGVGVAVAVLVTTALAARRAQRLGIAKSTVWDVAFWVAIAGLVGSRLLYVAEYWRDFVPEPWRILAVWEGGMSAFGGGIAGTLAGFWYARRRRLVVSAVAAAVTPAVLLGDGIGRLGGALSHMYPGIPTTFPISFVLDGVQRHEVGIELALASFFGFVVIAWLDRRHRWLDRAPDRIAPAVLLWYSVERLTLDFLRATDLPVSDLRYLSLTLAQYAALAGIVVAGVLFRRRRGMLSP